VTGIPRRWLWPPGSPRFPLAVTGHGRIAHAYLAAAHRRRLRDLTQAEPPAQCGVLFVLDGRGRRRTLYSPDPTTSRCSPAAHTLDLYAAVFTVKFPDWNAGWQFP
jgi:hypothetical protein